MSRVWKWPPLGEGLFDAVRERLLDKGEEPTTVRVRVRTKHGPGEYIVWPDGTWTFNMLEEDDLDPPNYHLDERILR